MSVYNKRDDSSFLVEVQFELKETHSLILLSLLFYGEIPLKGLEYTIRVLKDTNYDYFKIFNVDIKQYLSKFRSRSIYTAKEIETPFELYIGSLIDPSLEEIEKCKNELIKYDFVKINEITELRTKGYYRNEVIDEILITTPQGLDIAKRIFNKRKCYIRPLMEQQHIVFIACAFGKEDIDLLYENEFENSISDNNLELFRVDFKEPYQTITNSIIENIKNARCLIADLTYARPSVYFEIGFALGLGIPCILTCRKDHYNNNSDNLKVHFDLQQFKISYWEVDDNNLFSWPSNMSPKTRLYNILNRKNTGY